MSLLRVQNLSVHFRTDRGIVRAVENVNFEIANGHAVGIIGESGCGKTTLALSILRLLPPSRALVSGAIFFEKQDLLSLPDAALDRIRGKEITIVFQEPGSALNPLLRVREQIRQLLQFHQGLSAHEADKKVAELLAEVRLSDASHVAKQYPHQLSGGMQQRVMIAMAIACRPALLIADEPTTALDATTEAEILDLLKHLRAKLDMSLLLISHKLDIVQSLCDTIVVMYAGKIVEAGESSRVTRSPKHPYTQAFLACRVANKTTGRLPSIPGEVPDLRNPPTGCRFHPRCPYAMAKCLAVEPSLLPVDGALAACHLYPQQN